VNERAHEDEDDYEDEDEDRESEGAREAKAKPDAAPVRRSARTRTVVLHHIGLAVRDLDGARAFYTAALGAIGMNVNLDFSSAFGMGSRDENIFWLARHPDASGGGHYAFRVDHREDVDAFHAAALAAGGKDHGKPGPRPNYGPRYYAAFVKDREDNNIEVVCYK
jgi:catechol 2,3-dioxygenase-like lactoylglutathione lyase family enzyme